MCFRIPTTPPVCAHVKEEQHPVERTRQPLRVEFVCDALVPRGSIVMLEFLEVRL